MEQTFVINSKRSIVPAELWGMIEDSDKTKGIIKITKLKNKRKRGN